MTPRELLIKEVWRRLGGGLVRVELTPEHFDDALNYALSIYRQRSSNSVEERVAFLDLIEGQNEYTLPDEIIEVRQIFRAGPGGVTSGVGSNFEPFGATIANQTLLGGQGLSNQSSLVTYELFTGFQELVGTMFGLHILFNWHPTQHRLNIVRNIRAPETVMLWVYNYRTENDLLADPYARPWIWRATMAQCKLILGEARSKFGSLAGPQGGTSLNGDSMKAEGQQEWADLLQEINTQVEQSMGYGFLIG